MVIYMKPEIKFESPNIKRVAFFQCIGGSKPIATVWHNIDEWLTRINLDFKTRRFAGFDDPHPAWMSPPHGYIAFMLLNDDEGDNHYYEGVFIYEFDSSGLYVSVQVPIENMNIAWDTLNEFKKDSAYTFDTESGRQYFEEHIFAGDKFNQHPTYFKLWMPVKEK